LEITLHDDTRIKLSWVRRNLLHLELWQRGHLGKDVLLLKSSRLLDGQDLARLKALLAGGPDEPTPDQPLAA
jgi:hypothetical protein